MKIFKEISIFLFVIPFLTHAADFDAQKFQAKLNALISSKQYKNVRLGIAISQLHDGKNLFLLNETTTFMPASTIKLILSAAAIRYYSLDTCFQVPICSDKAIENGTIHGNIYLKGIGAPTILFDSLSLAIKRLKQRGLKHIKGNIVYDDFVFEVQAPRFPPLARDRWAPGGALVLNSNRIELKIISRTPNFGIEKFPNTAYAKIYADLKYLDSDRPSSPDMRYQMKTDGDEFTLKGTVTRWTEQTKYLALGATRPGLYLATVFKEALEAEGITVEGKIVHEKCPEGVAALSYISSPSVRDMLFVMNTNSDNIIAENLLWKIGLDQQGPPSNAKKGGQALELFVKSITKTNDFVCADGSGLSTDNHISPDSFIKLLSHFYRQVPELLQVLPTEGLSTSQLEVRGKSGTLAANGLNALAGYILHKNSNAAFCFIIICRRQPNPAKLWSGTLTNPIMEILLESIQ